MAEVVVVYVLMFTFGGVVVAAAVVVRRTMDKGRPSDLVMVFRVQRNATINAKKGRIMKQGVILPLGPVKVVQGRRKMLVAYYGQGRPREAKDEVKFWVGAAALKKCSRTEWIPLPSTDTEAPDEGTPESVSGFEILTPLPGPRFHSDEAQAHLETSHALRQWDRQAVSP